MKLFLAVLIPALTLCAQEAKPTGMFWHFYEGAQKCDTDWNVVAKTRTEAFKNLDTKVAEGDPAKIKLYMSRAQDAQSKVGSAWACGSDFARNLEEHAGVALNSTSTSHGISGFATEEEYDRAMALVKKLRKEIEDRPLTSEQRSTWEAAVRKIGHDPSDIFYKLSD